jgi:hypothetical protein
VNRRGQTTVHPPSRIDCRAAAVAAARARTARGRFAWAAVVENTAMAHRGAERRRAAASSIRPARVARGDVGRGVAMFKKILIANRGAERRRAAASFIRPARVARGDVGRGVAMFKKILIANRGAERRRTAASFILPARVARGDFAAG